MTRLVVDTDTASDDAVALLLAARTPGVTIEAITTVAGNVPLPQATRNALLTLEIAGAAEVPVHAGCERPLLRSPQTAQHVHGDDGMSDAPLPEPTGAARSEHAVDALLRLACDHGADLTLVTLGPLTNLAAALLRDRNLLGRFRHTYCMAGAADARGNITATAEFNVWADPEAAAIVCDAATPDTVTWIGWDASRRDAVMTPERQRRLRALGTPLALFADRINRAVDTFATTVTGLDGYDLPDPLAMAVALEPGLIQQAEEARVHVATGGEARGQLLVDRRGTAAPPNLRLVRRVDTEGFQRMLLNACRGEAA
ncbi:nucleoside hydrolase [Cryptosporangium minutisporangium]|uniref:Nucleoside hydrolase n=1 Tax=Cryptosporangium minutisporangium TaxID=113569 RepID=A0ABP6TD49_9ACTN